MKDTQKKKKEEIRRNYHLLRRVEPWKCCRVSVPFVQTAAEFKQMREI